MVGWDLTAFSAQGWLYRAIVVCTFDTWRNTKSTAKIKQTRNTKNLDNNNETTYQAVHTHTYTHAK